MVGVDKLIMQYRNEQIALARHRPAHPLMHSIAKDTVAKHGLTMKQLRGTGQTAAICSCRKEFCIVCTAAGKNDSEIGRFLNRDRTTICHYRRYVKAA